MRNENSHSSYPTFYLMEVLFMYLCKNRNSMKYLITCLFIVFSIQLRGQAVPDYDEGDTIHNDDGQTIRSKDGVATDTTTALLYKTDWIKLADAFLAFKYDMKEEEMLIVHRL